MLGSSRALFTKSGLQSRRAFSTLAQETRIISPRLGGRSSVSGIVCTVFGGSGQTGKYVIDRLGSSGCSLIVPYRDDGMWVRVCKVSGDPGQIQPMPYDLKDEDSIRQVVAKSNIVINLTGTSKSTSHFDLREANCFVPHRIAKVCKEVGVERFIHFSALGASKESSSKFFQAKAESEEAVKSFYPNATIIRPAPIYSKEDDFINRLATTARLFNVIPLANPDQRLQPVAVHDVARAVQQIVLNPSFDGNIFELAGEREVTMDGLARIIFKMMGKDAKIPHLGAQIGQAVGILQDFLPAQMRGLLTEEFALQSLTDRIPSNSNNVKSLADLSLTPSPFDESILKVVKIHSTWGSSPTHYRGTVKGVGPTKWQPY